MKPFSILAACAGFACVSAIAASAAETAPDNVTHDDYGSVAESLTGTAGDAASGATIMTDRGLGNCIACHEVSALKDAPWHGEVGPTLDGAGDRWTEADLRGIVVNSKMVFDGTIMPAYYKNSGFVRAGDLYTGKAAPADLPPILTAQQVEDVVAFLMTLQD
ncbi:sulfur oxidation c-type cytochrome SoxX [Meridianimarinicoccus aquatilis]|uniref:Sulfur oxidation c-type cytochrome SoxX n=1 Tax=Meridianimarinicoccus aquatilis TaxID=2552766 RepID=A0A4R6B4W0_9RHOB|nr:sulfur oxidation c-type cytochrome SoxX [Fluviibacterium aquatile]QIE42040.1 sulfur oxidation c-type cytochrome SoxX [Rhodobacteraceae bacterium SC52]TDL90738.1 sulfur oxidation c-type cytochrome SoxX [Fluviibacterium aquatile]